MNKLKALIGLLIIFNLVYFRFIRERLMGPINPPGSIWKILITLFIIYIYIYLLFRVLKPLKKVNNFLLTISTIYQGVLFEAYLMITEILAKYNYYLTIENKFIPFWCNIHRQVHIYLIFLCKYVIPLFIPLIFVIEAYIYKEIKYFPRVILLMFFYFLLDFLWFIGIHHANEAIKFYNEIFIIKEDDKKTISIKVNTNLSK